VSNDFTTLSQNFERTCKLPNENTNRTELRALGDTPLSCSEWKEAYHNNTQNSCIYLNENSKLDKCQVLRVRECTKNDNTVQAFCQYFTDFSDCHCTQWSFKSAILSPDLTKISHNFVRTCQSPYDRTNKTEIKIVVNQTLSKCSEWQSNYNKNTMHPCLFVNQEGVYNSTPCSEVQSRRCISDNAIGIQYICQRVASPCATCSDWLKTAQSRSSDLKNLTTQYKRSCPNGTVQSREETQSCSLVCTPYKVHQENSAGECTLYRYNSVSPDEQQCLQLHKQTCASHDCNFTVSVCERRLGVTCTLCTPWVRSSTLSLSSDFKNVTIHQQRVCQTNNESVTEKRAQDCPLQCGDWSPLNETSFAGECIHLKKKETSSKCSSDQIRSCRSSECNIGMNYCQSIDFMCPSTVEPYTTADPYTTGNPNIAGKNIIY